MKKRFQDWLKLTEKSPKTQSNAPGKMILMRALPGFQKVEDQILLTSSRIDKISPELEDLVNKVSKQTFGIDLTDTEFKVPAGFYDLPESSERRWEIEDNWFDFDNQFQTVQMTDDEVTAFLLDRGLDFRDTRGAPMRCVKLFARQAEAVTIGLMGKMPDFEEVSLQSWATALETEAKKHLLKKRP